MKKPDNTKYYKIIMLMSAVLLMMLLCGCRTRISNNTEVTQMLSDEDGWIQESYQIRRDELGIPVAEPPLFTMPGSDEEVYDEEYEEDEEYEDEEFEEDEEFDEDEELEDDEESVTTSSPVTSTTPSVTPGTNYVSRPSITQTQPAAVSVTLNLNGKGAKCSITSLSVRKDSTYGALPTPTRDGYEFKGWYTAKKKGKKVTSTTKVTTSKAHTLYAQWKEIKRKSFTVTFDGNGEEDEVELSSSEITVQEGGKYGDLPSAKRRKYTFKGWFTDPEGGSQIKSGTAFTDNKNQTLYAHWESDPYKWWKGEFEKAANEIDPETQMECFVEDGEDKDYSFLEGCRLIKAEDETTAAVIIRFVKNYDEEEAQKEAEAIKAKYAETAPDAMVIVASHDALYGDKPVKLIYKIKLLDSVYGSSFDVDEAEYDLLKGEQAGWYSY